MPACLMALGMASEGAVVKRAGACAASAQPMIFAIGGMLYLSRAARETRRRAAAPSDIGDELGAVTVPLASAKAGLTARSLVSLSFEHSSSTSTTLSGLPRPPETVTGTISSLK